MGPTIRFRLDAAALARAGASEVLAIDPRAIGSTLALAPAKPVAVERGVALVHLFGPLAQRASADLCGYVDGYDAIAARVTVALDDPRCSAVVLVIDSPGGDVAGVEEGIRRMQAARDRTGKPVVAYVDELAASAAYWIAACVASGGIYGPTSARVGSVGVLGALIDETKALEMAGIGVKIIRSPDGKADGHPASPLSALAEQRARTLIAATAERFFAAVATARGLTPEKVRKLDAAVLSGFEAVAAGLLTGVKSLEEVVALAASQGAPSPQHDARAVAAAVATFGAPSSASRPTEPDAATVASLGRMGLTVDDWREGQALEAAERAERELPRLFRAAARDGRWPDDATRRDHERMGLTLADFIAAHS